MPNKALKQHAYESSIRKRGFNPKRRPCLTCMKNGKTREEAMFDSLDETDRYCPQHKIAKRALNQWHYYEEDFGAGFIM